MLTIRSPHNSKITVARRGIAAVGVVVLVSSVVQLARNGAGGADRSRSPSPSTTAPPLAGLDPQARCGQALALVAVAQPWPMACRWREPTDGFQGRAFPPPKGDPPFDEPRIEIYVDPAQTVEDLASAIAHELGHMHHTREATFGPEWLSRRGLPADTPVEVWVEDYAEVFAALYAPPSDQWRAQTPRPSAEALEALKARFFAHA